MVAAHIYGRGDGTSTSPVITDSGVGVPSDGDVTPGLGGPGGGGTGRRAGGGALSESEMAWDAQALYNPATRNPTPNT